MAARREVVAPTRSTPAAEAEVVAGGGPSGLAASVPQQKSDRRRPMPP
jgi:hypothetical protein